MSGRGGEAGGRESYGHAIHQGFHLIFNLDFYEVWRMGHVISHTRPSSTGWSINSFHPCSSRTQAAPDLSLYLMTVVVVVMVVMLAVMVVVIIMPLVGMGVMVEVMIGL